MSSDQALLDIGHKCTSPSCGLVDFLPIKCQHCAQPYCSDHFKPQAHSCPKFDATKHDRVAPECPFCGTPVAFAAGADPNIAMEKHFETKCEVVRGGGLVGMKSRATTKGGDGEPRCARARCNKVLIVPIKCPSCSEAFCAEHRFPATHNCKATSSAPSTSSTPKPAAYRASTSTASKASTPAALRSREPTPSAPSSSTPPARTNAALAAINRAAASTKAAVHSHAASPPSPKKSASTSSQAPTTTTTTASHSIHNPFNKTDRWDPLYSSSVNSQPQTSSSSSQTQSPSTTTTSLPKSDLTIISRPTPIIPQSFIPRSIFGTA